MIMFDCDVFIGTSFNTECSSLSVRRLNCNSCWSCCYGAMPWIWFTKVADFCKLLEGWL